MQAFEGIWLPLITPFRDGEVDLPAARRLVSHYIDAGIHGFVVCGTTGEAATLDETEQLAMLDVVLEGVDGRRPVVMGVTSNDTRETLRMLRAIERRPVAGLLSAAPYYSRPSQLGIAAHFRAIAAETPLPLILYNIPYRTGVNIDLATVQALADVPTIVAIKESGGNMNQLMDLIRETRLQVLSGEDHLIFTTLCLGGAGAIAAAAHLRPQQHVQVYESFRAGDVMLARELASDLLPITRALFAEENPAPIKALLAQQGFIAEELRLPMTPVSSAFRDSLLRNFAGAGLG
jgi:4-hydroxy-tetrahydrodipicolinate synthase